MDLEVYGIGMLKISKITNLNDLGEIKSLWDSIVKTNNLSLFQSYDWNYLWCKYVLESNKDSKLNIILVQDGNGDPIAIIPLFSTKPIGPFLKINHFLGHRMSYHNDVLLVESDNKGLINDLIDILIKQMSMNEMLHFRHLSSHSSFTQTLIEKKLAQVQCSRVYVEKDLNNAEPESRLRGGTRKSFRKRKKRLFRDYSCEFVYINGEQFLEGFERLIELHLRRFEHAKSSSLLTGQNLEFLKEALFHFNKQDKTQILELRADGHVIASQLAVYDVNHCFLINCGFDPEFSKYSPLRILLAEIMQDAFINRDCDLVDFGPGYEDYKYDWMPSIDKNYFACVGNESIYGRMMSSAYQYVFKRSLPSSRFENKVQ